MATPSQKADYALRERERIHKYRKESSLEAREISDWVPECANWDRRIGALADVYQFLELYFGHRFYNPLTRMQRDFIEAVLYRATHGGNQAFAAPRGEGKTTISECLIIYGILSGLLKFPVILAANDKAAKEILKNIMEEFETNELLCKDFPEVCGPILALEGGTSRQKMQVLKGKRTMMEWSVDRVVFPTVPKSYRSNCCGSIIMARGIDTAIRGARKGSQRPDFGLGDDLETRESAASELQIENRKKVLLNDASGMGGQRKRIPLVITGTCQNQYCLTYQLTDPVQFPAFAGRRYGLLDSMPEDRNLMEEYISRRKAAMIKGDPQAKEANDWYRENLPDIEAGASAINRARFSPDLEHSAIQHCFNIMADIGMSAFLSEYQNDPPEEDELNPDQITSKLVRKRITGLGHQELPADCLKVVSFVDLGDRNFNWTDTAWGEECIGSILDYGLTDVRSGEFNPKTRTRDPRTLELAVIAALHEWRSQLLGKYVDVNGQTRGVDLALIDSGSGLHTKAVYKFCREVGPPFHPSKGMRDGWKIQTDCLKSGDRWALMRQKDGTRLYEFESTYWKKFCHERFVTDTHDLNMQRAKGSLGLFICPEQQQFLTNRLEFSHQIVGQVWGVKKAGSKPTWIQNGKDHFLDSTAGTCLGANICGIKIVADKPKQKSLSLAAMAAQAKR